MRAKKYNKNKQKQKDMKRLVNSSYIINVNNKDGLCRLIDSHGNELDINLQTNIEMVSRKHQWTVYMAGLGISGNDRYTKADMVGPTPYILQEELIELLNDEHQKVLKGFNPSQLCGFGWIASPSGHNFSESQAFSLFEKYGAFENSLN